MKYLIDKNNYEILEYYTYSRRDPSSNGSIFSKALNRWLKIGSDITFISTPKITVEPTGYMIKPDIIFETDQWIALNKPHGLLSIPDREGKDISLKQLLQEKYGQIFTVHRLDRNTSGVIVFAKDEETHKFLSQAFEDRLVQKFYLGIVNGILPEKKNTIDQPIAENTTKRGVMIIHKRGKPSVTDYEVLEEFGKYSFVRFQIHTGRTHQIRIHMQYLGHPLVCDELYGDSTPILISSIKRKFKLSKNALEERPIMHRLALHAGELDFIDAAGIKYKLEAEMPKDMRALLQQLRKWKG